MLCEKSGAILIVLIGLMVGQQSDKILVDLKFLKIIIYKSEKVVRSILVVDVMLFHVDPYL